MRFFPVVFVAGCFIKPPPPGIDVDGKAADDAMPDPPENYAFVSSMKTAPGAFGGIDKADGMCQDLATAAHLHGDYIAWVSDASHDAASRLAATNAQGWIRLDGKPFANTISDLTTGRILYPLRVTETKVDLTDLGSEAELAVATGTGPDGKDFPGGDCGGFQMATAGTSVLTGFADAAGRKWAADGQDFPCSTPMRIYCLGTSKRAPVTVVPESTRLVFVTATSISASAGVAAFNVRCGDEARSAGRMGTFVAAVATTNSSVRSRFSPGPSWVRPDGVTAMPSDWSRMEAPIFLTADNAIADAFVWAGAPTFTDLGTAVCTNWSTTSGNTLVGDASRSGLNGFGQTTVGCIFPGVHIYCFQQ